MKPAAALLLLTVASTSVSTAANITYYVDLTIGVGSVTGDIVTDGKIGVLGQADIVGWNLAVTSAAGVSFLMLPGTLQPSTQINGVDLSATASQLMFNFSGSDGGSFKVSNSVGGGVLCFSALANCVLVTGVGEGVGMSLIAGPSGVGGDSFQFIAVSGSLIIGTAHPAFFTGEALAPGGAGFYDLHFSDGIPFGSYLYLRGNVAANPITRASVSFFHLDMGYEAFIAVPGSDIYLYDYATTHWWYTSDTVFPYLYDFALNSWVYYFQDTTNPGRYTANPRYFSNLTTGKIFTM